MRFFLFLFLIFFNLTISVAHELRKLLDDPDVDFSLSSLTLTSSDEKSFSYSYNLTNSGSSEIQGYSLKLTFSEDGVLGPEDDFVLFVPLQDAPSQYIGPNQTVLKTGDYLAGSPPEFLPAGSWYIFAEINHNRIVPETNFLNNTVRSTGKLTVADYTIPFIPVPIIDGITDNSFVINVSFQTGETRIYYRVENNGSPIPSESMMLGSDGLFPWENQVTIFDLGPAVDYDVYFIGEFYNGTVTEIYKLDVKTLGTVVPTLVVSEEKVILAATSNTEDSSPGTYSLKGFHLTANVLVTASQNFAISKDDINYTSQLTYLPSLFDQGSSQLIYVKYLSVGTAGLQSGSIDNSSAGATSKPVSVELTVYDPANTDFNGIESLHQAGWTTYSVTGYHTWSLVDLEESPPNQRQAGDNKAVQIDGSLNGFTANEDWLISPALDLSGYLYDPTIKFRSYSSGDGAPLVLKYSADYPGFGDPTLATWFDADVEFPEPNSNEWKKSILPVFNKESRIFYAFVYTSNASAGSRWTIDDWSIADNLLIIPSNTITFSEVEVGTMSASQSFDVKLAGYGDVTVSVSESFQISLDNLTFSSTVVINENEAEEGQTIYVRFTPLVRVEEKQGTLTFTGTDLDVTRSTLTGSSLLATSIERSVEFTGFIYPNPTSGPVYVDIHSISVQENEFPVLVSNSIGSTVIEFSAAIGSLESRLSDVISGLRPGLYYITIQGNETIYRNKLIRN